MFQYAAGRALAERAGTELLLDTRLYDRPYNREYGLDKFNINARIATPQELSAWPQWQRKPSEWMQRIGVSTRWYRELRFGFDPAWNSLGDDLYIEGYFQSEKYFSDVREILISEFRMKKRLSAENERMADMARKSESVMLHVRRGDYVSSPKAAEQHGACTLSYYRRAIEKMRENIQAPKFFIFSDDLEWARKNLPLPADSIFVTGNQLQPEVDIFLMAQGKSHVIANSSFSWWGAWLCTNTDSFVVSPRPWFATEIAGSSDIYNSRWTILEKT